MNLERKLVLQSCNVTDIHNKHHYLLHCESSVRIQIDINLKYEYVQ